MSLFVSVFQKKKYHLSLAGENTGNNDVSVQALYTPEDPWDWYITYIYHKNQPFM